VGGVYASPRGRARLYGGGCWRYGGLYRDSTATAGVSTGTTGVATLSTVLTLLSEPLGRPAFRLTASIFYYTPIKLFVGPSYDNFEVDRMCQVHESIRLISNMEGHVAQLATVRAVE